MDYDFADPKHKGYTSQVDKSLKAFEYSTEWADLISALGRLIKVIQSNSKSNHVPRSLLVGKRLAQCLHPALPPGVHCKALECYDIIFRTIGPRGMSTELPIYGAGLFTLLGPSAMAVKPALFDIFEEHLLPLGRALRPAFIGLLQGLLPGLEQGAEFSERGNRTIELFCASVAPHVFYTCLWELLITAPSVRQFGISFVLNHFNKRKSFEEQNFIYGTDKLILIRSLCCLFGDSAMLVQRDALDFLQIALPIHFHVDASVRISADALSRDDYVLLCRSALSVLLRRDASLNRRLFGWLKGSQPMDAPKSGRSASHARQPVSLAQSILMDAVDTCDDKTDSTKEHESASQDLYFERFSRAILTDALRQIINDPNCLPLSNNFVDLWGCGTIGLKALYANMAVDRNISERPLRILAGLLDRSDIGGKVMKDLLNDILWYTYSQFHALRKRSISWLTSDSLSTVSQEFGGLLPNGCLDEITTLIIDHVLAKDSTKSVSSVIQTNHEQENPTISSVTMNNEDGNDLSPDCNTTDSTRTCPQRPSVANEFLRGAHLFFNSLDQTFLWSHIQSEFKLLLLLSNTRDRWFSLNRVCRVVQFMLTHLPIETYPEVCGLHLPELASQLIQFVIAKVESDDNDASLTVTQLSNVLCVLRSIIEHISKFVLSLFDRSAIFSFSQSNEDDRGSLTIPLAAEYNVNTLAPMIGEFRKLLGVFCIRIFRFSSEHLAQFMKSIHQPPTPSTISQTPCVEKTAIYAEWLDLFAQMCRIVLQMSNFPLLVVNNESKPDVKRVSSSRLMQLFSGHLVQTSDGPTLPQWLICLLYAATEVDYFDLKAISLYTLLELFSASTSVHGCDSTMTSPVKNHESGQFEATLEGESVCLRWRLTFPVLSGKLLAYVFNRTNVLVRIGISLWHYLAPCYPAYHDDVANLLLGLHQLTPTAASIGSSSIEAFVLSQMLSTDLRTQVDAQARFVLLWHLMRPRVGSRAAESTIADSGGGGFHAANSSVSEFRGAISSPCWRRLMMHSGKQCKVDSEGPISNSVQRNFPFYRCALLLLDNLDSDSPWGPVGPIGSAGLSAGCGDSLTRGLSHACDWSPESHNIGLIRSVLREQAIQWVLRALRTGQVDRLVAPLLAALLHPATVRVSLKAHVLQENARVARKSQTAWKQSDEGIESKQHAANPVLNGELSETLSTVVAPNELGSHAFDSSSTDDVLPRDILSMLRSNLDVPTDEFSFDPKRTERLRLVKQCRASVLLNQLVSSVAPLTCLSLRHLLDEGDEPLSMLPLHEHLLIHLQSYDANQVVYALSRFRAIISVAPALFVSTLATYPISNGIHSNLFGLSLPELLVRHQRAQRGGNFYGATTADESAQMLTTRTSLLDVVVNLCLSIMCSQLPYASNPSSGCQTSAQPKRYQFAENEFRANKCAQKTAAEVLELILKELSRLQCKSLYPRDGPSHSQSTSALFSIDTHPAIFNGRRVVEDLSRRTCLTSVILHCLATCVEVAHWPSTFERWMTEKSDADFNALPVCLRLLIVNELSANLPASFHSLHLSALLRLTQAMLDLRPWNADRLESTVPKSLMPNTIWPSSCESKPPTEQIIKIWAQALRSLPASLKRMPMLTSICLSAFWPCEQIHSSHPVHEQGVLLLDILTLALSSPRASNLAHPVTRRDLHPIWFHFVFSTLCSWGVFTPHFVRVVVNQVCSNLVNITQRASVAVGSTDEGCQLDPVEDVLPPDYTLASLACLQGIYHALLLPGGSAASALLLTRSSPDHLVNASYPSACELAGFPASVSHASALAEKLHSLQQSSGTRPIVAVEAARAVGSALTPPLNHSGATSAVLHRCNSFTEGPNAKPSDECTVDVQGSSVVFTSRAKEMFNPINSPDPDSHPLIQAQTELIFQLPSVLNALAALWDTFNSVSCPNTTDHSLPPDHPWPPGPTIPFAKLPLVTALGCADSVLPAIRMFLDPIARHHPASFVLNLAMAWPANLISPKVGGSDVQQPMTSVITLLSRTVNPDVCGNVDPSPVLALPLLPQQTSLLRLLTGYVSSGNHFGPILPMPTLVKQVRNLVRRPCTGVAVLLAKAAGQSSDADVEERTSTLASFATRVQINLLHMFYALLASNIHTVSPDQLLSLLRDLICLPVTPVANHTTSSTSATSSPTITPIAVFILVKIFDIFLQMTSTSDDKREQRELQELCHRLLESTASVAASALKQPTWFRRTHQVASPDALSTQTKDEEADKHSSLTTSESSGSLFTSANQANGQSSNPDTNMEEVQCSSSSLNLPSLDTNYRAKSSGDLTIQAMELLTEHMSSFLDVVYRSDEKDRVPTFLTGLLSIIFPYLRVRLQSNSDRFTAASKTLASVSSYQYTRKAWSREALNLFYEVNFFQMPPQALHSWNAIIDYLMTQDRSTFREALARLTFSQPTTLNLFSSKEAEHDLRAACLKKLSYLVYASEPDQYAKAMPDLLERLTECLRLSAGIVPQVHAQVFVFARTLISRMSAMQLTSLWPIVIPELMMVLKTLSNHLQQCCDSKHPVPELSVKEKAMFLGAFKLLATGIIMPEFKAPQFSFYKWIFVNSCASKQGENTSSNLPTFVPQISEIWERLQRSTPNEQNQTKPPLTTLHGCLYALSLKQLNQLPDLIPFLHSLENPPSSTADTTPPHCSSQSHFTRDTTLLVDVAVEAALALEFPEPIVAR